MNSYLAATILVPLLIKLAVIALLAGFIARFGRFRKLIVIEQRSPSEKLEFAVFLGVPFTLGVLARLLAGYPSTDLSLEVTVVAGLLGGTIASLVVGMMVSLPAFLIGHESLAVPMAVLYAVVAGTARWVCPDKEEIWKFSGFIDLSLYLRSNNVSNTRRWTGRCCFLFCVSCSKSRASHSAGRGMENLSTIWTPRIGGPGA